MVTDSYGDAPGGGSGIRTHVTVSRKHAFQACAFSHSATPPQRAGAECAFKLSQVKPRRFAVRSPYAGGRVQGGTISMTLALTRPAGLRNSPATTRHLR